MYTEAMLTTMLVIGVSVLCITAIILLRKTDRLSNEIDEIKKELEDLKNPKFK